MHDSMSPLGIAHSLEFRIALVKNFIKMNVWTNARYCFIRTGIYSVIFVKRYWIQFLSFSLIQFSYFIAMHFGVKSNCIETFASKFSHIHIQNAIHMFGWSIKCHRIHFRFDIITDDLDFDCEHFIGNCL